MRHLPTKRCTHCKRPIANTTSSQIRKSSSTLKQRASSTREVFRLIEKHLQINELDDWYKFSGTDVRKAAIALSIKPEYSYVLNKYNASFVRALTQHVYPNHNWDLLKFKCANKNLYSEQSVKRKLFEIVAAELNIKRPEDWYDQSLQSVQEAANRANIGKGFRAMITMKYGSSIMKALFDLFPEFTWEVSKFKHARNQLSKDAIVPLLKQLEQELNIKKLSDWYKYSQKDVHDAAAKFDFRSKLKHIVVSQFDSNFVDALRHVYPDEDWTPLKFKKAPRNTLASNEHQRQVFKIVEQELGIQNPTDWYKYNHKAVIEAADRAGVAPRLRSIIGNHFHNHSFSSVLKVVFPEYNLNEAMFQRMPKSNETTHALVKAVVNLIEHKLNIRQLDDWYRVSQEQIARLAKLQFVKHKGGLVALLPMVYPLHNWDISRLQNKKRLKRAQQWLLYGVIKNLMQGGVNDAETFPNIEVFEDYVHETLRYPETNEQLQLDVYVPHYKLAFEYHGIQHYKDVEVFGTYREFQLRDNRRRKLCRAFGITLIEVPYYSWKMDWQTIAATINQLRPDIPLRCNMSELASAKPIPQPEIEEDLSDDEYIQRLEQEYQRIAAIKQQQQVNNSTPKKKAEQPETAAKHKYKAQEMDELLMHPSVWDLERDPKNWYVSPKYVGVRVYWDGVDLVSSKGNVVSFAPADLRRKLPRNVHLDALLVIPGLSQDEVVNIFKKKDNSLMSASLSRLYVYDMVLQPADPNSSEPRFLSFEERYKKLSSLIPSNSDNVKLLPFEKCESRAHLESFIQECKQKENVDGVLLRKPNTPYLPGRSAYWCRHDILDETYVKMLNLYEKNGQYFLLCEQEDGKRVFVGCDGNVLADVPRPGEMIVVKHKGRSASTKLRHPFFQRRVRATG